MATLGSVGSGLGSCCCLKDERWDSLVAGIGLQECWCDGDSVMEERAAV